MKTRITELLNIDYPIFQGGMAWVADGDLAGAVSKAGGLGIIGGGNAPKEVVNDLILSIFALTTSLGAFPPPIIPSPPALETAPAKSPSATQAIPPWKIG